MASFLLSVVSAEWEVSGNLHIGKNIAMGFKAFLILSQSNKNP